MTCDGHWLEGEKMRRSLLNKEKLKEARAHQLPWAH
jgi:hypothetical protein